MSETDHIPDAKKMLQPSKNGGVLPQATGSALPPICWVHRPHNLSGKIEEAEDLCSECCDIRVEKYRAEYPDQADEIIADGGWDQCRESEGLATCDECGRDLGCYLLDTFDDVAEWDDEDRCIDTAEKVSRARARFQEQDSQNESR